jgi:hypothetical protein
MFWAMLALYSDIELELSISMVNLGFPGTVRLSSKKGDAIAIISKNVLKHLNIKIIFLSFFLELKYVSNSNLLLNFINVFLVNHMRKIRTGIIEIRM